jgi:hypothetical protein
VVFLELISDLCSFSGLISMAGQKLSPEQLQSLPPGSVITMSGWDEARAKMALSLVLLEQFSQLSLACKDPITKQVLRDACVRGVAGFSPNGLY